MIQFIVDVLEEARVWLVVTCGLLLSTTLILTTLLALLLCWKWMLK